MARQTTRRTVQRAKVLRRTMSLPEVLLWRELKGADLKFRKQHPVGPFVVDFYCAAAKLAIEVDGLAHDMGNRPERDIERDQFIRERGIEVLRIPASEVLGNPNAVAEGIVALCRERVA
ncbi:MAG: DUF559 domain-containing protein [Altererythrobacter sp.]